LRFPFFVISANNLPISHKNITRMCYECYRIGDCYGTRLHRNQIEESHRSINGKKGYIKEDDIRAKTTAALADVRAWTLEALDLTVDPRNETIVVMHDEKVMHKLYYAAAT